MFFASCYDGKKYSYYYYYVKCSTKKYIYHVFWCTYVRSNYQMIINVIIIMGDNLCTILTIQNTMKEN